MREKYELLVHFIITLIKILKPGGLKMVMAENMALKQQLITISRTRKRAPKLTTFDRFFFGILGFLINTKRILKIGVIIKPATIIKFHQAIVKRKYHLLYSAKKRQRPGRKGPDQQLVNLLLEMKARNPNFGYSRISMQIHEAFGIMISPFAVGRILRKYGYKGPPNNGPSWLTFLGHMKDSLWSIDLFRCESITLKSHWVMVVMDQFTRRIIGFAVHVGDPCGVDICCMFNKIISGRRLLPKYLSTDNDPLFKYHRWQANLRILDIKEIKSVPYTPSSHPFIERVIGTCRREFLDHILFFNERDLQQKLSHFKNYYNETRVHSSLALKTPSCKAIDSKNEVRNIASLNRYCWKPHANGLYQLPVAA